MVATSDKATGEVRAEPLTALCRAVKNRSAWLLIIDSCALCARTHVHGGGYGAEPSYGSRAAHCVTDQVSGYELRPDGAA